MDERRIAGDQPGSMEGGGFGVSNYEHEAAPAMFQLGGRHCGVFFHASTVVDSVQKDDRQPAYNTCCKDVAGLEDALLVFDGWRAENSWIADSLLVSLSCGQQDLCSHPHKLEACFEKTLIVVRMAYINVREVFFTSSNPPTRYCALQFMPSYICSSLTILSFSMTM